MIINHNMSAMYAQRQMGLASDSIQKDIGKLSSGQRIATAGDDPAGLAVSEKMRAQIRGLNQASRNALDGISLVQTAEGYLQETDSVLHRMRELSVQAANGTYTNEDRMQISVEMTQMSDEIDRIAQSAQFNTINLLDGHLAYGATQPVATTAGDGTTDAAATAAPQSTDSTGVGLTLHIGANTDQEIVLGINNMSMNALFADNGKPSVDSADEANKGISLLDGAMAKVNKQRADLGAYQNRLESSIRSINNAAENLQSAESRIRDADMAKQMVNFTRDQILQQAGNSMLAQANVQNQSVLQLLQ